ncbi:tripartite tricarboxylate transporter substrate binding protein [Pelagibacterium sp. H642]|uniref:Bug family tripartite tricarboxylate transporter substrate binding protein n=1 Tax=Pelagibacterium sp. H642 TaxID=1881069 RepID=UPI002815CF5B|nr:tripartite tricarboxylate transporter substrate binding protein [Pelagibacterium sp. H642]WMT91944.1 tripartite tricarboxylate transporter substrate binding protein [Pelagibacterium sp. H642]
MDFKLDRRQFMWGASALAAGLAAPATLRAQSWPSGPVTIVCGFSPGGTTDTLARILANSLSARFGQPVIVENRTGAAGAIGMTSVAEAEPDGQTLLFSAVGQLVVVPHVSDNLTIDPVSDLAHISLLAEGDFILNASIGSGFNTVDELIEGAKSGTVLYGTSGAGGNLHLFTEAFLHAAGIESRGVHYQGGSALMPDLLNNQVQFALNSYNLSAPYIEEGQLKPLLVVGKERNAALPDVPTGPEVGLDSLASCMDWFGLHAPAGTPAEIIETLAQATRASLDEPEMASRIETGGLRPVGSTPDEFAERIRSDYALFGEIAEASGMATG